MAHIRFSDFQYLLVFGDIDYLDFAETNFISYNYKAIIDKLSHCRPILKYPLRASAIYKIKTDKSLTNVYGADRLNKNGNFILFNDNPDIVIGFINFDDYIFCKLKYDWVEWHSPV